jgi:hypothetical protein
MTAPANPIQHSFELAAARCDDLTPLVYDRLFREHPETGRCFAAREANWSGLDAGADDRSRCWILPAIAPGRFRMIECEVQSHDAYGTPRELFGKFFA